MNNGAERYMAIADLLNNWTGFLIGNLLFEFNRICGKNVIPKKQHIVVT